MAKIYNARELKVYKLAYETAIEIYHLTKSFPSEEKYDLISQIRRSSRSVPANLMKHGEDEDTQRILFQN